MLKIKVCVLNDSRDKNGNVLWNPEPIRLYEMDHDDPAERRVLGEQCRNAFEGGQLVMTYPVNPRG